jgi:hypothetical protein
VPPTVPPTLASLVAARLLDARLAALIWLLAECGVPVLVAGRDAATAGALLAALVGALPADRRPDATAPVAAGRLVLVRATLAADSPPGVLRAALAATTGRSGLAATVAADDLAGGLDVLARQGMTDDEVSFLGTVLVVARPPEAGGSARVVAAHYLRPVVLDAGGHPRRLGPAVLATWDAALDAWQDFSWGIVPDLAGRARMRAGDLEAECDLRAAELGAAGGPGARADPPVV